jgi:hypothetical protein
MYIVLENNEVIGIAEQPNPDFLSVIVPNDYIVRTRGGIVNEGIVTVIPGTIVSNSEITRLQNLHTDKTNRKVKIDTDITSFVGRNVSTLNATEKIALLSLVLYKLGVIDAVGVVQNYENWFEI